MIPMCNKWLLRQVGFSLFINEHVLLIEKPSSFYKGYSFVDG